MRKNKKNEVIEKDENITKHIYFRNLSDINFKLDLVRNTIHNIISLFDRIPTEFDFNAVKKNNNELINKIDDINLILLEIINKFDIKF